MPQSSGDVEVNTNLKSNKAVDSLGFMVRANGDRRNIMTVLKGKLEDWTVNIKNGCLPARLVWQRYTLQ